MTGYALHHVTAISGPAQRNLDFYTGTLGLRMVKKTVNFDDPGTFHFYFGNKNAEPGSILTFFPWENAAAGRLGVGETQETVLRVPEASIGFWTHRLLAKGVTHEAPVKRFGETVIAFRDPDGMRLALAGMPGIEAEEGWETADVPAEHAVRGLHGVTLLLEDAAATAAILTDVFGFEQGATEGPTTRYQVAGARLGSVVDLRAVGGFPRGRQGAGSVHHIAFRAPDDATEFALRERLLSQHGIRTTDQRDRDYFRSLYFREPGGVLFEIATDIPGFTVDEPFETLGQSLKLPRQYEAQRREIEAVLPKLDA
ncbi:glyoxalase/bleomycin resistance protein/dioxygenase [Stappia sp. 22II-S9-Z10]|nr:glyoxalase/bleomycin resistance protein/dioxygenase [Stappia sp. 22II-S9-Z10]